MSSFPLDRARRDTTRDPATFAGRPRIGRSVSA